MGVSPRHRHGVDDGASHDFDGLSQLGSLSGDDLDRDGDDGGAPPVDDGGGGGDDGFEAPWPLSAPVSLVAATPSLARQVLQRHGWQPCDMAMIASLLAFATSALAHAQAWDKAAALARRVAAVWPVLLAACGGGLAESAPREPDDGQHG